MDWFLYDRDFRHQGVKHGPKRANQGRLKRTFEKRHTKSHLSNMTLVCHVYERQSNRRESLKNILKRAS